MPVKPNTNQAKIADVLRQNPAKAFTAAELAKQIPELEPAQCRRAGKSLENKGLVEVNKEPNKIPYHPDLEKVLLERYKESILREIGIPPEEWDEEWERLQKEAVWTSQPHCIFRWVAKDN